MYSSLLQKKITDIKIIYELKMNIRDKYIYKIMKNIPIIPIVIGIAIIFSNPILGETYPLSDKVDEMTENINKLEVQKQDRVKERLSIIEKEQSVEFEEKIDENNKIYIQKLDLTIQKLDVDIQELSDQLSTYLENRQSNKEALNIDDAWFHLFGWPVFGIGATSMYKKINKFQKYGEKITIKRFFKCLIGKDKLIS